MAIGGMIGGAIDPTKITGPHVGDGQAQSATDGSAISWVMGTMWVAGTIVDVGKRQEFKVKQSGGKGSGTEQYSYEAHQNFTIVVCESDELKGSSIGGVLMVEQDGKIVYDVRLGSTMLADSQKWLARNCIFYYGDEAQLPTAADEGAHGVGNAPAYRGVLRAFFTQFNVTAVGDRIPNFRFLVSRSGGYSFGGVPFIAAEATPNSAFVMGAISSADITEQNARGFKLTISKNNSSAYRVRVFCGYSLTDPDIPSSGLGNQATTTWINGNSDDVSAYNVPDATGTLSARVFGEPPKIDTGWTGNYASSTMPPAWGDRAYGGMEFISLDGRSIAWVGVEIYSVDSGGTGPKAPEVNLSFLVSQGVTVPKLDGIIRSICGRGGVADTDTSETATTDVTGYAIAKQMNAVDALGPLLGAHFAYASEYDSKINFHFFGADAVMTIDEADILAENDANNGNITENLRNNATEFPKRIIGKYYDPAQNYMPVTVMQTRRAAGVTATGELSMDIPVVMPADQAQQTVDKALKVAYAQLEGTIDLSVPFAGKVNVYLSLVAGDPVIFRGKRWIVKEPIISTGYIKLTLQYDRQSAYTSDVQAIHGLDPTPPQSRYSGPTTLVPMNLPSLRTQDTYGVYLAAKGANDQESWRGCNVLVSYDDQQSWQNALVISLPSVIGTLDAEIPSGGEPITLNIGDVDQLESITDQQVAAQMNAFALGGASGFEIGQFKTTVQLSDGDWEITDVSRGLNGTTEGTHVVGDPFVMLDSVSFLPIDLAFAGKTLYFRGVGFGENADDQPIVSLVYNPDTTIIHDGGTVT